MARYTTTRLLTPPREEEEVYPYRRVWRSIAYETGMTFVVAAILFVAVNLLGASVPPVVRAPLNLVIALLPAVLWLVFSLLREQRVQAPRRQLLPVFLVSALVANAIGIPFVENVLRVEEWLTLESAINRILGYTFTIGIVQEFLKYGILRYMVWSDHLRIRLDSVAYSTAAAVGYVTVVNLHFIAAGEPSPDVVAARVFANLVLHVISGAIVAYGLSESRFRDAVAYMLPMTLAAAAFVTGLSIPVRAGLVNAAFSLEAAVSAPRPLFGLGFSLVLLVLPLLLLGFLFENAERRTREMQAEDEG